VSGLTRTFTRFTAASLIATGISQVVLLWLVWTGALAASAASAVAFLTGTLPHFMMVRRWVWGRRGRGGRAMDVLAYVLVTALGGAASIGVTTLVDWLVGPMVTERAWRTIMLNAAYLAGGAPLFVLKFAVLRLVFTRGSAPPPRDEAAPASSSRSTQPA